MDKDEIDGAENLERERDKYGVPGILPQNYEEIVRHVTEIQMIERQPNCASVQDSSTRKAIRKVRLLYLAFFVAGLLGGLPLVVLPLRTEEIGWSLLTMCNFAFLGFFAVAVRYALNYSWLRTAGVLAVILCLPIISLILLVILDHRLYVVSKETSALPARAMRLAESRQGFSYFLLLTDIAVLLLLCVFVTASRDSFREVFIETVEGRLPHATVFFLNTPLWAWRLALGSSCLALVVKEYTWNDRGKRLRTNLAVAVLGLVCGIVYFLSMFCPIVKIINNLGQ